MLKLGVIGTNIITDQMLDAFASSRSDLPGITC